MLRGHEDASITSFEDSSMSCVVPCAFKICAQRQHCLLARFVALLLDRPMACAHQQTQGKYLAGLPAGQLTSQLGAGAKRALEKVLWRDLHGRRINYQFTKATLPYKRAIAFHAKCAYRQAALRGHVPASFDATLVEHEYWSVKGARQKVSVYLAHLNQACRNCCAPHLLYVFSCLLHVTDDNLHAMQVENYLKGLEAVVLTAEEISPDDSPDAAASPASS